MDEFPIWKRELQAFPHKLFNDLANTLVEFYVIGYRVSVEPRVRERRWAWVRGAAA